jgi:uncharacterized protein (TIGR00266 family)
MEHKIAHAPTFTTLEVGFRAGESLMVQPGCMVAMTTGFDLTAGMGEHMSGSGGVTRATRSFLAGESFLTARYTAKRDDEHLTLAPDQTGEIRALTIDSSCNFLLASGAFLACTSNVRISLKYMGVKGFMSTRGLYMMRTEGEGLVFISSYGALVERSLAEGERYVLDNRYIVSFTESTKFEMVKVASSLKHAYFSGEGLVNRFTGPGTLLYQTRARPSAGFLRGILNLAT